MAALDWSQCPAVESIPGKVSGAWVFKGTRLPVATVIENLEYWISWLKVSARTPSRLVLILFDHGTPKGLAPALSGHTVHTAQAKGWGTVSNGELSSAAEEAGFELLLTTDRRIRHQQNLRVRRIALVVLTGSTKWSRVRQCVDRIDREVRLRNILVEVTVTAIRHQLLRSGRDWHQRIECALTMFIKPSPVSVGRHRGLADDEQCEREHRRFANHNRSFD